MDDLGALIMGFYGAKTHKRFLKFLTLTQVEVLAGMVHCDFLFLMSTPEQGNNSNNPQHQGLKSLTLFRWRRWDSQQVWKVLCFFISSSCLWDALLKLWEIQSLHWINVNCLTCALFSVLPYDPGFPAVHHPQTAEKLGFRCNVFTGFSSFSLQLLRN